MEQIRYRAGLWCGCGQSTSGPGGRLLSTLRYPLCERLSSSSRRGPGQRYYLPPAIARRANASPISTKAEVTSGPPTRMRVGVFILFHS